MCEVSSVSVNFTFCFYVDNTTKSTAPEGEWFFHMTNINGLDINQTEPN